MEIETESTNKEDKSLNKIIPLKTHMVIDDGALLDKLFWSGSTFTEVLNEYRPYVPSRYKIVK